MLNTITTHIDRSVIASRDYVIMITVAFITLLGTLYFPTDWPGWLIFALSFLPLFFLNPLKKNKFLFLAMLISLTSHHIISMLNAYVVHIPGSQIDAQAFHQTAILAALGKKTLLIQTNTQYYPWFLSKLYLLSPSQFFGQEVSVFVFFLVIICLIKIMQTIAIPEKYHALIVLCFALAPNTLFWTSITLREPYQLFFLLSAILCELKLLDMMNKNDRRLLPLTLFVVNLVFLSLLHNYLFVIALSLFFFFCVEQVRKCFYSFKSISQLAALFCLFFCFFILLLKMEFLHFPIQFEKITLKRLLTAVNYYHQALVGYTASTSYLPYTPIHSLYFLVLYIPKALMYYLFYPWPWAVKNLLTLSASLYAGVKAFLLAAILWNTFKKGEHPPVKHSKFLLYVYLSITTLFALGALNYGTAMRHHILTDWIVYMLGIPLMLPQLGKLFYVAKEKFSLSPRFIK